MWCGDFSNLHEDFLELVDCKSHKHQIIENLKNGIWEIGIPEKESLVWFVRKKCMEPLLFEKNFDEEYPQLTGWAKQGMLLPDEGRDFIPDGRADTDIREIVKLADSIAYHLSLMLQSLFILSDKCAFNKKLLIEYRQRSEEILSCYNLEEAMRCIGCDDLYKIIWKSINRDSEKNKKMVISAFMITIQLFLISCLSFSENTADEMKGISCDKNEALELKTMGNCEYKDQQFSQAIASYTKAIKISRYNSVLYSNRALAYLKLHKWVEAELDSRRAIILRPDWLKGYHRLAQALEGQSEYHFAHNVCNFGKNRCAYLDYADLSELDSFKHQLVRQCETNYGLCYTHKKIGERHITEFGKYSKEKKQTNINDVPDLVPTSSDSDEDSSTYEEIIEHKNLEEGSLQPSTIWSFEKDVPLQQKSNCTTFPVTADNPKSPKQTENIPSTQIPVSTDTKNLSILIKELKQSLKSGSEAFLKGCSRSAKAYYQQALSTISKVDSVEDLGLDETDLVVINYTFGMANLECEQKEEIQKAISIFEDIIENHKNVRFPTAYYGLGYAYFKKNRFKEALVPLLSGKDILEKGIVYGVNQWPGTLEIIELTKPGNLKEAIEELIQQCRYPPRPDAVCRFEECNFNKSIFYHDVDFRGFTRLRCSEQCSLEYHPSCWKQMKDQIKMKNEKEFVNSRCMTPDCKGTITIIVIVDKDGKVSKEFFDKIQENQVEQPKHRKTRLEKKMEQKEKRKRRYQDNNNPAEKIFSKDKQLLEKCESDEDESEPHLLPKNLESLNTTQQEEGEVNRSCKKEVLKNNSDSQSPKHVIYPVGTEPSYVLKREADDDSKKITDVKETKKKKQKRKNILSLEEFCGESPNFLFNEYQQRLKHLQENKRMVEEGNDYWLQFCALQADRIPQLDPERPFYIPQDLRNDSETLETILQSYGGIGEPDDIRHTKEAIYSYMEEFLNCNGPKLVYDSVISQEVSSFPTEAQTIISEVGGIANFLLGSIKFALVGDYICTTSASNILKAYRLSNQGSSINSSADVLDSFEDLNVLYNNCFEEVLNFDEETGVSDFIHNLETSALNPDAAVYNPSGLDVYNEIENKEQPDHREMHNGSGDGQLQKQCGIDSISEIRESLLSTLKNLRQPIYKSSELDMIVSKVNENVDSVGEEVYNGEACNQGAVLATPVCYDPISDEISTTVSNTEDNLDVKDVSKLGSNIDLALTQLKKAVMAVPGHYRTDILISVVNGVVSSGLMTTKDFGTINYHLKGVRISPKSKLLNKASQSYDVKVEKVSVGVMKTDEELEELQELVSRLKLDEKNAEDRLVDALDNFTRLQNKMSVETNRLKKEAEDAREYAKKIEEEWQKGLHLIEVEKKKWQQDRNKWSEEIKQAQKETLSAHVQKDRAEMERNELLQKLAKVHKDLETEHNNSLHLQDTIQSIVSEFEDMSDRVKKAEMNLVEFKKAEGIRQLKRSRDVAMKIFDMLKGERANNLLFASPLSQYVKEFEQFIRVLEEHQVSFLQVADEQLRGLATGKSLKEYPELTLPDIPDPLSLIQTSQGAVPGILDHMTGVFPFLENHRMGTSFLPTSTGVPLMPFQTPASIRLPIQTTASPLLRGMLPRTMVSPPPGLLDTVSSHTDALKTAKSDDNVMNQNGQNAFKSKKESMKDLDAIELLPEIQMHVKPRERSSSQESYNKDRLKNSRQNTPQVPDSSSKKSFEKLLEKLSMKHPQLNQAMLKDYIKIFRAQRNNKLSGLTIDAIVAGVSNEIEKSFKDSGVKLRSSENSHTTPCKAASASKPLSSNGMGLDKFDKLKSAWIQPKDQQTCWSGVESEDNICAICLENISAQSAKKVDCGHTFHSKCIKDWLGEQSTCPSCRVYVVLEEEFPSLNK
ncbi:E3 ubiquitin-protein ligase TTC3-like [Limulus polyphemus]|uniref:RING-type E3 ubiquitin transferase n=1 Tax=Limulus polyphemus TaxID=6850 RepID=A0ABM1B5F7_LIMPO|nr:E3 ubiquitin-protein ligase TTC3-like [Limulus polyphemus]XP_013775190.1 E3 ubiquitin-protein ligase TTC3-like [Limulus polyphemus]XP_022242361.1 E3 ubiquitin-protein ligase TTC3-like [Limulus polyphemus]XP_022242362.1 E3 ubiquitin-protein ligase TTC3-like [Limulus polyphemus]XP_022242363.1 E3 ubiquitin-protein ligase TTC3-like [Limulus polyphemus]